MAAFLLANAQSPRFEAGLVCGTGVGIGGPIAAADWNILQGAGACPSFFGVNTVGGWIFLPASEREPS